MASYPYMVQTAWYTLSAVLDQWQKEPFRWARERDLQAEIGGRLNQVFSLQGLGSVTGPYGHGLSDYKDTQTWARVAFEPYVPYIYDGKPAWCHPDIVIWDELDGRTPPDYSAGHIWPIAWACELKYASQDPGTWDIEKLGLLIGQEQIQYGCSVNVQFSRASGKDGFVWESSTTHGRFLWLCQVQTPPLETTGNE